MKVLGTTKEGYDDAYIVSVTKSELKAAFEKGYSSELPAYKPGDVIDLTSIPDQRARIVSATNAMRNAYTEFVKAAPVMADFARLAATMPQQIPTPATTPGDES